MGYSITLYAVDLERLRAAVGSCDTALLRRIRRREAEEFEADEDWFGEAAAGKLTLREALEELVAGKWTSPNSGGQYGYALELLCRDLGKRAELEVSPELVAGTALARARLPLEIPPPEDFPVISHLTPEEARAALSGRTVPGGDRAEEWEALAGCLMTAARRGWGVVSFYY